MLDGSGKPLCIVETTEVTIRHYNEVDADFAQAEGEGDFSLDYWREAHQKFLFENPAKNRTGIFRGYAFGV